MKKITGILTLLALAALGQASTASYHVTQEAGPLRGINAGVFGFGDAYLLLDFKLTDGGGIGDGSALAQISNLTLTGGTIDYANRILPDLGDVVDGGPQGFTLLGTAPVSDRAIVFRMSALSAILSYDVTLTSTGAATPIPDGFNVGLLYRTGFGLNAVGSVPTLGPAGLELLASEIDAVDPSPLGSFAVDPVFAAAQKALGDSRFANFLPAKVVPVPEPAPLAILVPGTIALVRGVEKADARSPCWLRLAKGVVRRSDSSAHPGANSRHVEWRVVFSSKDRSTRVRDSVPFVDRLPSNPKACCVTGAREEPRKGGDLCDSKSVWNAFQPHPEWLAGGRCGIGTCDPFGVNENMRRSPLVFQSQEVSGRPMPSLPIERHLRDQNTWWSLTRGQQ